VCAWQPQPAPDPDDRDRALVVDDEEYLADAVEMALRHAGMKVQTAADGRGALEAVAAFDPDIVLLDVMLPDVDGWEVCRQLRATGSDVPVLFLTARDSTEDTVAGFTAGGDDYLTKPFAVDELVARTRAILRRTKPLRSRSGSRLTYADLVVDLDSREVWRAGTPVELTATEFELLGYLLTNAGRVLTKSQLLDAVWSYDFGGNPNVLETYISYLRRKLDPLGPPLIQTVRGVGYTLRLHRAGGP
jgi:two-component system OmpR family response regulator